jgi:hypothetical protein
LRKLHPAPPHERLLAQGIETTPQGDESWSVHEAPAGRLVLRVDGPSGLWHAVLAPDGSAERVQVRLPAPSGEDAADAGPVDATFTFFEGEVLVWRRGASPAAEALPAGGRCRLAWPPRACAAHLANAPAEAGVFRLRLAPRAEGGVVGAMES